MDFLNYEKEFYEPGEKLKADVKLKFRKTEKITSKLCSSRSELGQNKKTFLLGINCEILGYAKCKWYEDQGDGKVVEYNHGRESYIKECFNLRGEFENNQIVISAGEHKFDIAYLLSPHLPTSFKCKNGAIKYKIVIIVERSWKKNSKFEFPFTVISPLNLNDNGGFSRNPMKEELTKSFKLDFNSEPLYISASIPFCGYVPGQTIDIKIQVNNQSKTHVKEVKVSLKKIVSLNGQKPRRKTFELIFSEAKVSTDSVPVSTMKHFEKQLLVPSLPPNILNCEVIQVQYELRVKAMTSGLNRSPKVKIPITIGTVPLIVRNRPIPTSSSSTNLRK